MSTHILDDEFGKYKDIPLMGVPTRFRKIQTGGYLFGAPPNQIPALILKDFWLADTACTQELWKAVMGNNPAQFNTNPQNPVENVSWLDVQYFLQKINEHLSPLHVQLPTEAQWEYACRAGTITPFYFGENITPAFVNYNGQHPYHHAQKGRHRQHTVAVKSLPCNAWGLYEMHGNVWEWCQDVWQITLENSLILDNSATCIPDIDANWRDRRVLRGGSWVAVGRFCRSAFRNGDDPSYHYNHVGFRLVCSLT